MDKTTVAISVGGAALIALVLFRMRKTDASTNVTVNPETIVQAANNGDPVVPGGVNSPGFSSTINVTANPQLLAQLSQKYVPLFGFVGTTGNGGSVPSKITTNVIVNQSILPAVARQALPQMPQIPPQRNNGLNMSVATRIT